MYKIKIKVDNLAQEGWALIDSKISDLLNKLKNNSQSLKSYTENKIYRGVLTGLNEAFVVDSKKGKNLLEECSELIKPYLAGRDIKRYQLAKKDKYMIIISYTN